MGVKVAGPCRTCKKIYNGESEGTRVTWRGPCPVKGCTGTVMARRVLVTAKTTDAATEPAVTAEPVITRKPKRKVVKVDGYNDDKPKANGESTDSESTDSDGSGDASDEPTGESPEPVTETKPKPVHPEGKGKRRRIGIRFDHPYSELGF